MRIIVFKLLILCMTILSLACQSEKEDQDQSHSDDYMSAVRRASLGHLRPLPQNDHFFYQNGQHDPVKVELGRLLFHDKILSGNRNISCATCHSRLLASGDGVSLPVGEGGRGLGATRHTGHGRDQIKTRVPRNSPPLFNLGAIEFTTMFFDGRLELDPSSPTGMRSPAGEQLPYGLDNILAAQAMFPVTSADEMAGQRGENRQADLAERKDFLGLWDYIADKVRCIPEYADLFRQVYGIEKSQITYVHIANAIGAYQADQFRADQSPFDEYLLGDAGALSPEAQEGLDLFYGRANCVSCHSGLFQTDHKFYNIALPQIGPGKGDGFLSREDFGRERVTQNPQDRYRFRTPSLRNVALTGPWGHNGAYSDLKAMVRHHTNPRLYLENYDESQAILAPDFRFSELDFSVHRNPESRYRLTYSIDIQPVVLNEDEIDKIIAFLHSLTDPNSLDLGNFVPQRVPSGLPVFD